MTDEILEELLVPQTNQEESVEETPTTEHDVAEETKSALTKFDEIQATETPETSVLEGTVAEQSKQIARLEGQLEAFVKLHEKDPEAAADSLYDNPGLQTYLEKIQTDNPDNIVPAMMELFKQLSGDLNKRMDKEVSSLKSEVEKTGKSTEAKQAIRERIDANLIAVKNLQDQPTAHELIREYESAGSDSLKGQTRLGQYIQMNPGMVLSESALATGILGLAALVESAVATAELTQDQSATQEVVETTGAEGKGTPRTQQLTKTQARDEERDEEDVILDDLAEAEKLDPIIAELYAV